jgi:adenosine deaminase/adenosine deaminase CECR1
MLAEVTSNAAAQHISYLELMVTFSGQDVRAVGASVGWDPDLDRLQQALFRHGLRDYIASARREIDEAERVMQERLHCDSLSPDPGCKVSIRYLQQSDRGKPREEVFASLVFAFELVRADERVVGLNLVFPEDAPRSLQNYDEHMRMLDFLWRQNPGTNISLHAGELTLGLVPLRDLRSHIRSAVEVGHARRIGHGVSIAYEDNAFNLLRSLAQRRTLIEINLTSNEQILGVQNEDHPFIDYWNYGVPVTLSTDDEGVARSDLTNEYVMAARRYNLSYENLKTLARNSVAYSFLPGASMWADTSSFSRIAECANDMPGEVSADCGAFLKGNTKAWQEWRLESEFDEFERQYIPVTPQAP